MNQEKMYLKERQNNAKNKQVKNDVWMTHHVNYQTMTILVNRTFM